MNVEQLELFLPAPLAKAPRAPAPSREEALMGADALARRLAGELRLQVRLSVTDNRSTMVSYARKSGGLTLRIHHMFLDAPEAILRALADYAGRGHLRAGRVLDGYIRAQESRIRTERRRAAELKPRGRCFDLGEIFDALNGRFFQGTIQARVGWGRAVSRRRRKTIRLGVYDHQTREIRIHPALDKADVPRFFVEYIVFHEMLHQLFPSARHDGRHVHHPKAFKDREKAFPHYAAALAWEKQHLHALLRR